METNWVKSEILLQTTVSFCMTWHPKTHQHSGNTGDGDYWLVIADLIISLPQMDKKKLVLQNHNSIITTLADIQCVIFWDQFLQSIMCLFYSPSQMQSWWSQGAQEDFEVQKSRSCLRLKIHSPGISLLRCSDLKWTEWNWANWK